MIDTILFDMDGTVLNTLEDLKDSTNYALTSFGLPKRSLEEVRKFVGNGVELLIERAVDGALTKTDQDKCLATFKKHYSQNMNNKTCPYDGILDLIKTLLEKRYKIAIVSNKFDSAVKDLNRIYFEGLFPVAIGSTEFLAKKPSPDLVMKALTELESDGKNTLYVGDSDVDCLTAKNSHLSFVGVTWGFRDEELLRSLGAECIIHKPEQLLEILNRRNHS